MLPLLATRKTFLPFSRPSIGKEEIDEVIDTLKSGWITTGPKVQQFESNFSRYTRSPHSVAVNSATSGLHIAYLAAGIAPGDEVITTPLTFISTVSMLLAIGAKPVLVDIDPKTLNIDCSKIERKISKRTRAIVPVHFAGLPCDMDEIHKIAKKYRLKVIEDAAHAIGSEYKGKRIGSLSDATVFSFHPIKNITTGEGGMVNTPHKKWAEELTLLRFHGMSKSAWKRYHQPLAPHYEIERLGFKYNMMDIQAALGIHQLKKLNEFNKKRARYARLYTEAFQGMPQILLQQMPSYEHLHSWHLFVVVLNTKKVSLSRGELLQKLGEANIGTGIHFNAVHRNSYYKKFFGSEIQDLENANFVSDRIFSLPLYPDLKEEDIAYVIKKVKKCVSPS